MCADFSGLSNGNYGGQPAEPGGDVGSKDDGSFFEAGSGVCGSVTRARGDTRTGTRSNDGTNARSNANSGSDGTFDGFWSCAAGGSHEGGRQCCGHGTGIAKEEVSCGCFPAWQRQALSSGCRALWRRGFHRESKRAAREGRLQAVTATMGEGIGQRTDSLVVASDTGM